MKLWINMEGLFAVYQILADNGVLTLAIPCYINYVCLLQIYCLYQILEHGYLFKN